MAIDINQIRMIMKKASEGGYAVPHFNFNDCWDLSAIIEAAEEEQSPIFVATIPKVVKTHGIELCAAMAKIAMKNAKVPIIPHLDHSTEIDLCKSAIDCGYPSVMIDASALPLEDNIRMINRVIEYAHPRGVHVEAELGRIKGKNAEGAFEGEDFLVNVEEAKVLVKQTGVDSLAIGIGTAHGFYADKPEINYERLCEVNAAIETPLVLHGGTGIPAEDVRRAIACGMNKVNVGTIIRYTYLDTMRQAIESMGAATHPSDIFKPVREKIKEVVKDWIRVCMADGKA